MATPVRERERVSAGVSATCTEDDDMFFIHPIHFIRFRGIIKIMIPLEMTHLHTMLISIMRRKKRHAPVMRAIDGNAERFLSLTG